jgi:hypothetical protein
MPGSETPLHRYKSASYCGMSCSSARPDGFRRSNFEVAFRLVLISTRPLRLSAEGLTG